MPTPTADRRPPDFRRRITGIALASAGAVLLSLIFWGPLWQGGGFVGGDVYSYYFPQKVFYAAALEEGRVPLWNSWTGHGYPILGESQTGALYPPHLLLYSVLPVHAAWHAGWLLHFILAALFTWLAGRRLGMSHAAAGLAAVTYACGWFPARTCWEWSVTTGAWLPLAVWCTECFLTSRRWRYAIGLAVVTGVQLLAGHYHIAFLTQLLLAGYVPLRLWWAGPAEHDPPGSEPSTAKGGDFPARGHYRTISAIALLCAVAAGFGLAAVQLAPTWELRQNSQRAESGAQHDLRRGALPAWYWTQSIAPWYWYLPSVPRDRLLQEWAGAHSTHTNQAEAHLYFGLVPLLLCGIALAGAVRPRHRLRLVWAVLGLVALCLTPGWLVPLTQHLPGFGFFQGPGRYGLLTTFCVALLAGCGMDDLRRLPSRGCQVAFVLGMLYAAGSLLLLFSDTVDIYAEAGLQIPFELWGVWLPADGTVLVLQAAVGLVLVCGARLLLVSGGSRTLLAGPRKRQLSPPEESTPPTDSMAASGPLQLALPADRGTRVEEPVPPALRILLVVAMLLTVADLWLVSRLVTYSPMVADPPLKHLHESFIRKELADYGAGARLHAPYMNLPAVFGAGTVNPYFTFGPAAYADPERRLPDSGQYPDLTPRELERRQIEWLQQAGVTHVLSFEPLSDDLWPVQLVRQEVDPVFNRALGRPQAEKLFLYRLEGARGRVSIASDDTAHTSLIHLLEETPERIVANVSLDGPQQVMLTELSYPGWQVEIDGEPAKMEEARGMFLAVSVPAGDHRLEWMYRPGSVRVGALVSLLTFVVLAVLSHLRFWHPGLLSRMMKHSDAAGITGGDGSTRSSSPVTPESPGSS